MDRCKLNVRRDRLQYDIVHQSDLHIAPSMLFHLPLSWRTLSRMLILISYLQGWQILR